MKLSHSEKKAELGRHLSAASMLLFPDQRLAVFFSPKAAASSILNWYHRIHGLEQYAKDARTKFGAGKYELMLAHQSSATYGAVLEDLRESILRGESGDWTTVKIVRDPYDRAVSAFLMVLYLRNHTLSFRDFLSLPKAHFTRFGDGHCRQQFSELERLGVLKFNQILKIETGIDNILGGLEKQFNLASGLQSQSLHANKARYEPVGGMTGPVSELPIASEGLKLGKPVPPRQAFLDAHTKQAIYHHYREDFEAYGYPHGLGAGDTGFSVSEITPTARNFMRDELTGGLYSLVKALGPDQRIVFMGAGSTFMEFLFDKEFENQQIVAVLDNAPATRERWQYILGYNLNIPVLAPEDVTTLDFDKLVITSRDIPVVEAQMKALGVDENKFVSVKLLPEFHPLNMG
ncbi:sulfotransferase family protein [Kordiimonas pumila]|uniref:Sulfotransferase family protein n=1 Tax=Kordiimonas pumila TaxID=2161677 RepID=A0ABV7D083_9PROT|nr:hypothetical protein [Kordiimonas pumila]